MSLCIITGTEITQLNDSRAHVIPSALGGRLKPLGIITRDGNTLLGDKIDLPLIQAFQSLMNLLNGSRDRGQNQPTGMTDESGRKYTVRFGEPLALANPEYSETDVDGEIHIEIKARTLKEARTQLGRVKSRYPSFDVDDALAHAVTEHEWPDGMLHHQLQIGPRVIFPAFFVATSIFAVHHGHRPHPQLATYANSFDAENPVLPPDTFYFIPPASWIGTEAPVSHIVALIGDAANRRALAYVELFNLACVGVILPFDGSFDICISHATNIITGAEIHVQINENIIREIPWESTHILGDSQLFSFTKDRLGKIIQHAQQRQWDAMLEQLVERALGPDDGRRLNLNDYANLIREVGEAVKIFWRHPTSVPETRREELLQFDAICAQLSTGVPPSQRHQFYALIEPYRTALREAAAL